MTFEEMERTMQFILDQQASTSAGLESLTYKVNSLSEKIDGLADAQLRADPRISRLEEGFELMIKLVRNFDERLDHTTVAQAETNDTLNRLIDAQAETETRLNIFIDTVERLISDRGNGRSPN
jgi:chromosome segregation ATPase